MLKGGSHAKTRGGEFLPKEYRVGRAGMAALASSSLSGLVTSTGHLVDPPRNSLLPNCPFPLKPASLMLSSRAKCCPSESWGDVMEVGSAGQAGYTPTSEQIP